MAILIKGMEMPTSCEECILDHKFFKWLGCNKHVTGDTIADGERSPACPLIEVPPHGRLGDLDRLEQMFVDIDNAPYSGFDGTEPFYSAEDAAQIIRLAPTIIPAEKEGE